MPSANGQQLFRWSVTRNRQTVTPSRKNVVLRCPNLCLWRVCLNDGGPQGKARVLRNANDAACFVVSQSFSGPSTSRHIFFNLMSRRQRHIPSIFRDVLHLNFKSHTAHTTPPQKKNCPLDDSKPPFLTPFCTTGDRQRFFFLWVTPLTPEGRRKLQRGKCDVDGSSRTETITERRRCRQLVQF